MGRSWKDCRRPLVAAALPSTAQWGLFLLAEHGDLAHLFAPQDVYKSNITLTLALER